MAFDVMGAKQAGYTDQEIQTYLASKGQATTAPQQTQPQQEEGGLLRSLLPTGASILGGILGAPLGVPGIIGGSALFGGGARALTGGNLGDVAKEAALSGIGGLFPASRLLKAGKAAKVAGAGARAAEEVGAQTGENILTRVGQTLRKGVVNPQVGTGVKSALAEDTLTRQLGDLGISGSGQAKRIKSGQLYDQFSNEINTILSKSKAGQGLNKIGSNLIEQVSTKGEYFVPGDKTYEALLERELTNLSKKAVNGRVSAKALFEFKNEIGGQLKNAFRKESGDLNSPLTIPEQVRLDIWRNIDSLITGLEPGVKDLTLKQSILHQAAPGLAKESKKVLKLPGGIPIPGAARVGQAGQDLLGRGLVAGGQAAGKIPMPANLTPNVIGQVGTRALIGGPEEAQAAELPPMEGSLISSPKQSEQEQFRKALGMYALSKAKSPAELTSAYNLLYPKKASTEAADQFLQKASENIAALEASPNLGYGPLAGKFAEFQLGTLGGAGTSKDVVALNQRYNLLKLNILRAYQGARISDKDFELARLYIPSISDTEQTARTKLKILGDILVNAQPQEETPSSQSTIPMPADLGL